MSAGARPPTVAVFLLSGSALAYEILLVRLISIERFHHFAFMIISLALLGYGASGVLLAYARRRLTGDFTKWFAVFCAAFAPASVVCFNLSRHVDFVPHQWLWEPWQLVHLATLFLLLSIPFFFAACGVGLAFSVYGERSDRVYRADMTGAGCGGLASTPLLWLLSPGQALWLPFIGALCAGALTLLRGSPRRPVLTMLFLTALAVPALTPTGWTEPDTSPYKPLSVALSAAGAEVVAQHSSPLGRITVVQNDEIPFRYAPGLSLSHTEPVGAQWGAFTDGMGFAPLPVFSKEPPAYLDALPSALAYHLLREPRVLVLEGSVAQEPLTAVLHGAEQVDVVVSDPGWEELIGAELSNHLGPLYAREEVRLVTGGPRSVIRAVANDFDLAVIPAPPRATIGSDYLHTVEAFAQLLYRLAPGGLISVSLPADLPPRGALRLISTMREALHTSGIADPALNIAAVRSLQTVTLVASNIPLDRDQIKAIRNFCEERGFDPVWFPTMREEEANRYNKLDEPAYYKGGRALLGPERREFVESYKFDLTPATDERPYFSRFLKIGSLPELLRLRDAGGAGLLSWGLPVVLAALAQAVVITLLLIWLPLRRFRPFRGRLRLGAFFLSVGMGFMLMEVALIERFTLLLSEPLFAVALVLSGFLVAAGLGGGWSRRFIDEGDEGYRRAGFAALAVACVGGLYFVFLPELLPLLVGLPLAARAVASLVLLAPLAFVMGIPFPLCIAALKSIHPEAIPWGWGVNGCASVVAPIAAILLAGQIGIAGVHGAAAICYVAAAISMARVQ